MIAHIWFGALYEIIIHWLLTGRPTPLTTATPVLRTALLRSIGVEPLCPRGVKETVHEIPRRGARTGAVDVVVC